MGLGFGLIVVEDPVAGRGVCAVSTDEEGTRCGGFVGEMSGYRFGAGI